jgi:hypothetical protein
MHSSPVLPRLGEIDQNWAPPPAKARMVSDPWVRKLAIIAIACAGLMIVLFVIYRIVLSNGVHVT